MPSPHPVPPPALPPSVRDLLHLAARDDFDRTRATVARLGGCTRPIALTGHTTTVDVTTGEIVHAYASTEEPTGRLLLPCGNRRASRCPACSRIYAADTYHLFRAGLVGGKTVPDSVRAHPRVFATLTAPSFGPVHNRETSATGRALRCRCQTWHKAADPALGAPLDPAGYDYTGAVLFNAHAGQLWARFTTQLRRELAAHGDLPQRDLPGELRLSFAKAAEYQARGAVHFHAVIRLDGPEGPTTPPPPWASVATLTDAIRAAAARVALPADSTATGTLQLRFGAQTDVREITPDDGHHSDRAVAGYIAKYATKGAEGTGTLDHPLYCTACHGRGTHETPDGRLNDCRNCDGTGQAQPPASLPVRQHTRQLIRTCWDLAQIPEFAHLNLRRFAHTLGYRGHFATKSRRYSTTLTALRNDRRTWQTEQARIRVGRPAPDPVATETLASWRYDGTGYRPGEEPLAEAIRQERATALQLRHEAKKPARGTTACAW